MSSYYSAAQLEAMRLARVRQDLVATIEKMQAQLLEEYQNTARAERNENIVTSVTQEDITTSGYQFHGIVAENMGKSQGKRKSAGHNAGTDLSGLLSVKQHSKSKLETELDYWVGRIEERVLLTDEDASAHDRVFSEIKKIKDNHQLDIEDAVRFVKMRVLSYLQGGKTLTEEEKKQIESEYFQYCAMCSLANESATETLPYRVRKEISRLSALLEKRAKDEYIASSLREIMSELGCTLKSNVVMDHVEGQLFEVDGHPLCDVFVGIDGKGIMFEPVAESNTGSLDKKRRVESSANSICAKYAMVEELAAQKGIILRRVYWEPASLETVCLRDRLSESETKKKEERKTKVRKERFLTEGN